MFVIKSKTWIEDYYEVEYLYEDIVYSDYESAYSRLFEISKKQENSLFLTKEKEPLTVIRRHNDRNENDLKYLESESNYFLTIKKLELK